MSDRFQPVSMEVLCDWVFGEWETRKSIFGIPQEMFFRPREDDPFRTRVYGQPLDTPFGVAAGPHSQMTQNIIVAWLCGARFIELKTIQTLDELDVSKPCIDMQDVGYNCEWSQELKVHESIDEYVRAWVLIHVLHKLLGFPGDSPGIIFNMSVGYDMKGILQPNVQTFLSTMKNAEALIRDCMSVVVKYVPEASSIAIPSRLSDNVTLSTMHGCPPKEIGTISKYLMREHGLHTSVKLNPTLLGPQRLREILNDTLGFKDVTVPDEAFGHDLKYDDAKVLLKDLLKTGAECKVVFGVKLTNTLEVENHRPIFPEKENMMYLSGRPLHALTVNLASLLDSEFSGVLPMSFAGGADAFNSPKLLASGMMTITVCSDLLRSGGYTRMLQYIDTTRKDMIELGADDLVQFSCKVASRTFGFAKSKCASKMTYRACPRLNLKSYAKTVLNDSEYIRDTFYRKRTKTVRPLHQFDCIKAPCTDDCPINQKVPEYLNLVREGRWSEAARITREDNPLPSILGRVCDHLCENVCVRTHYDKPLAIKDIKRAIMDHEKKAQFPEQQTYRREEKIAVIGAGPCGLAVAYFMSLAGYQVELFEQRSYTGGMVSGTIPVYRSAADPVKYDINLVLSLGAKVHYDCSAGKDISLSKLRESGFAAIVIAVGAQRGGTLGIEGEDGDDVYDALTFLRASREGRPFPVGNNVAVIGGGDVAMDCARSAVRLGAAGTQVVYRRTIEQMPASRDELLELIEEEIPILELAGPKSIVRENGKVKSLQCIRMELGEPDASGRRRPVEVPGSEFGIPVDQVILAVSQSADLSFFDSEKPTLTRSGFIDVNENFETSLPDVYAGGDVGQAGPSSIVKALGDGKIIARTLRHKFEQIKSDAPKSDHGMPELSHEEQIDLLKRRAVREPRVPVPQIDLDKRENFNEVVLTLSDEDAAKEASRCLDCHKLCSYCVGVCPNMALFTYKNNFSGTWSLPKMAWRGDRWEETEQGLVTIGQRYQVAVLTDFCNECGNCVTFCPAAGKPYIDKPRIYLNQQEFEAESDNAYRIIHNGDQWSICSRNDGETFKLSVSGNQVEFEHPGLTASLDPATLEIKEVRDVQANGKNEISLAPVAGMWVLLNVFKNEMPYFPVVEE